MNYQGGCHCGRVAFDVDMEIGKVVQCNCSICSKKGHLLAFVTADKVTLHTAESDLSTYMFNTHRIRHQFCPVCGIALFGRGVDSKGNETFAINVRCLDGVDPSTLEVQAFDGRSL